MLLMKMLVFQRGQISAARNILVILVEALPDSQQQVLFEQVRNAASSIEESLRSLQPLDPEVLGELGRGYEEFVQSLSDNINLRQLDQPTNA